MNHLLLQGTKHNLSQEGAQQAYVSHLPLKHTAEACQPPTPGAYSRHMSTTYPWSVEQAHVSQLATTGVHSRHTSATYPWSVEQAHASHLPLECRTNTCQLPTPGV